MSHPNPQHDRDNQYRSDDSTSSKSYKKKLRGAVYRKNQEGSLVGKLKKLQRHKGSMSQTAALLNRMK